MDNVTLDVQFVGNKVYGQVLRNGKVIAHATSTAALEAAMRLLNLGWVWRGIGKFKE